VDKSQADPTVETRGDAPADEARREAQRRIGKYGAYTAPVLLAMMASEKAIAVTGGGCT
jgi:hypothetical protein